jgi:site-specific DNA-methyltransferase (adenine-specific)
MSVLHGDCRKILPTLPADHFDSIVVDPPYHLGFMGKAWDTAAAGKELAFQPETWAAALRVAKPGAWLAAFGGTRTHHRVMVAIEDAGWELRDVVMWVYGSGFPKSLNLCRCEGAPTPSPCIVTHGWVACARCHQPYQVGTALKPSWEPIILARKPFRGTVADNVERYGTGGLNVEDCRIPVLDAAYARNCSGDRGHDDNRTRGLEFGMTAGSASETGRWPANLVHDGSPEVLALFPDEAGAQMPVKGTEPGNIVRNTFNERGRVPGAFHGDEGSAARFYYCAKASKAEREAGLEQLEKRLLAYGNAAQAAVARGEGERAHKDGMNAIKARGNHHPTVKPVALMRWVARLLTPPGGKVLDFCAGSGSTGVACRLEGFEATLVEEDAQYVPIAQARNDATPEGLAL